MIPKFFEIVLELIVLETPGPRQPREHPPLFRFQHAPELARLHVGVAGKPDVRDLRLGAFANLKSDGAEAAYAIPVNGVTDRDLVVAGLLIEFAQLFRVLLDLAFIERLVRLHLGFFFQSAGLHALVAFEAYAQHPELRRDLDDDIERVWPNLLGLELHELEQTGPVQRTDVAIEHHLVKLAAV